MGSGAGVLEAATPTAPVGRARLATVVELAVVLLGALARAALARTYDARLGYDHDSHQRYIRYLVEHRALPPIESFYVAYQPPAYYAVAAWFLRAGGTSAGLQRLSVAVGVVKLLILWWALRRLLPRQALARVVALLAAALVPAAVFLDVMITNETALTLCSFAALALSPWALAPSRAPRSQAARGAVLGVVLALALLSKVSALVLIAAVAIAALDSRRRIAALTAVGLALALGLPLHARHYPSTRKLFPTTFDTTPWERNIYAGVAGRPYLSRRRPVYLIGLGSGEVLRNPYWPSDAIPTPRFWPQLVASTFADYYLGRFDAPPHPGEATAVLTFDRVVRASTLPYMRAAVAAGAVVVATTMAAWLAALAFALRRRDVVLLVPLLAAALAVVGQLHFTWQFPFDKLGMVKGHYLVFISPVLCALLGVAMSWLWSRGALGRAAFVLNAAALATVAAYVFHLLRWLP